MFTHKQLKRLTAKLKRENSDQWTKSPWIIKATSKLDNGWIAIHLLNPTQRELDNAIEDAFAKGFETIVIHNKRTFGKF